MEKSKILSEIRRAILITCILILSGSFAVISAQPHPPRPVVITVNHSQPLAFGAFTPGISGGTVTVSPDGGSRTATGTVMLLNMGMIYTPAMFYVRANPGTVLSLLVGPPATLPGSNGGSISLQLDDTYPASPFVTTVPYQQQTTVLLGGTLTVGNIGANPAGSYSATIYVTFVQE